MIFAQIGLFLSAAILASGEIQWRPQYIVDMTHPFIDGVTTGGFMLKTSVETSAKYDFSISKMSTPTYLGTHIEAPEFFLNGKGIFVDDIPKESLVAEGVVIDIRSKVKELGAESEVEVDDVTAWETVNGRIPDGAIVFMNSGWEAKYDDVMAYIGVKTEADGSKTANFPGFSEEVVKYLLKERNINGFAVDTAILDKGSDGYRKASKAAYDGSKYGLTRVKGIGQIPMKGAMITILPMLLADAASAPARVFAMWSDAAPTSAPGSGDVPETAGSSEGAQAGANSGATDGSSDGGSQTGDSGNNNDNGSQTGASGTALPDLRLFALAVIATFLANRLLRN